MGLGGEGLGAEGFGGGEDGGGGSSGSASLSLSGSGVAAVSATGSGSLSLSGSGAWTTVGTASLSLSGSGSWTSPPGTASITLSGAGAAAASASGSGSLSLSGTGAAGVGSSPADGTASVFLSAAGSGQASGVATASLSLSAAGDVLTGTASLSLSASGAGRASASGTGALSLSGAGGAGVGRTGTASVSLSAAGAVAVPRSGTAALSLSATGTAAIFIGGTVTAQGVGQINMVSETYVFPSEMRLELLDNVVHRAPTSITVTLSGAEAKTNVTFDIDGTDVYTVSTDSEGALGPTSLNLNTTLGTLGSHTVTATQVGTGGTITDSETFTVERAPSPYPGVAGVDAPPVEVPGALVTENGHLVRHWVFQDLLAEVEGGIGSYVFPHNPREMSSPHFEHALSSKHSTASDGKIHVFQAGGMPKEWQFTGYCPTQAHQEAILAYRGLNRRFWIIDHRNRAWKSVITSADFVPRLRQNYNGVVTDWGSDFTIGVTILDQEYVVPS